MPKFLWKMKIRKYFSQKFFRKAGTFLNTLPTLCRRTGVGYRSCPWYAMRYSDCRNSNMRDIFCCTSYGGSSAINFQFSFFSGERAVLPACGSPALSKCHHDCHVLAVTGSQKLLNIHQYDYYGCWYRIRWFQSILRYMDIHYVDLWLGINAQSLCGNGSCHCS